MIRISCKRNTSKTTHQRCDEYLFFRNFADGATRDKSTLLKILRYLNISLETYESKFKQKQVTPEKIVQSHKFCGDKR